MQKKQEVVAAASAAEETKSCGTMLTATKVLPNTELLLEPTYKEAFLMPPLPAVRNTLTTCRQAGRWGGGGTSLECVDVGVRSPRHRSWAHRSERHGALGSEGRSFSAPGRGPACPQTNTPARREQCRRQPRAPESQCMGQAVAGSGWAACERRCPR